MLIGQMPTLRMSRLPDIHLILYCFHCLSAILTFLRIIKKKLTANISGLMTQIVQQYLLCYFKSFPPPLCFLNISVKIRHMFNYSTFLASHNEEAVYEPGHADHLSASCFSFPCLSHSWMSDRLCVLPFPSFLFAVWLLLSLTSLWGVSP